MSLSKSQPKPEKEESSSSSACYDPSMPSFSGGDRVYLGLHTCGEFALREAREQAREKDKQTLDVHGILKSGVFGDQVHHVEHPVQDRVDQARDSDIRTIASEKTNKL